MSRTRSCQPIVAQNRRTHVTVVATDQTRTYMKLLETCRSMLMLKIEVRWS